MMHQGILSVAIPLLLILPSVAHSAFIITEPRAIRTKTTSFAKSVKGGGVVNLQIPPSLSLLCNENEKRSVRRSSLLRLSSVEDESSRNDDNGMDSMRKMLEASWDVGTMGVVPSDPQKAAESAATSIGKAIRDGKKVLCVDLLLPTYDASAGDNVYDEVLAVEFCTALSAILCQEDSGLNLKQCAVLVDEGKGERAVKRLFDGREKQRLEEESRRQAEANTIDIDDEEDEDEDGETLFSDDVDLFRQQLSSSWNDEIDTTTTPPSYENNNQPPPEQTETSSSISSSSPPYRIGSRIGDAQIPDGPDMFEQVMKAVDNQAVQASDDAIIIVSPYSRKDMIAVRRIVSRFGPSGPNSYERKPIILVNCKLNPLPQELNRAETVYSLLPLIARPKAPSGPGPTLPPKENGMPPPPKIVVLRRYPDDWEVFVDADGLGFELVDKAQANQCGPKGPPMQWISGCVQRHMTFKLGKNSRH